MKSGFLVALALAAFAASVQPLPVPAASRTTSFADEDAAEAQQHTSAAALSMERRDRDRNARLHQLKAFFQEHLPVPQTDDEYVPAKPKTTGVVRFYRTCGPPPSADAEAWRSDSTTVPMYFELPAAWTAKKSVTAMTLSTTESSAATEDDQVATTEIHKRSVDGSRPSHRISAEESLIRAIIGPKSKNAGGKRRSKKNVQNLISAKLRLFKIGRDGDDKPVSPMTVNPPPSTGCSQPSDETPTRIVLGTVTDFDPSVEKIHVSIYWYVASVQTGQDKRKKLLASTWFAMTESRWVEFEVTNAVNYWIESGVNNGIYVQVTHEDGRVLDASKYFSTIPCNEQGQNMTQLPAVGSIISAPLLEICSVKSNDAHRHRHHHGSHHQRPHVVASSDSSVTYEPLPSATAYSPTVIVPLPGSDEGAAVGASDSDHQSDVPQPPSSSSPRFSLPPSHPLRQIISSVLSGKSSQTKSSSSAQQRVYTFDDFSSEESSTDDLDESDVLLDTSRSSSSTSSGSRRFRPVGGHHRASKSTITISFTPSESRESSRESEVIKIQTGRDVEQDRR